MRIHYFILNLQLLFCQNILQHSKQIKKCMVIWEKMM